MMSVLSDKNLSVTPLSSSGHTSPLLSPSVSAGAMTPSFAPNVSSDYMSANDIASLGDRVSADDMELPEGLDMSLPISELLKIGTQRAHADAEHSEGAKELMRGTLGLEEYIRWNVILWRVYDALELALSEHDDNSVLAPTYDPRTLSRSTVLAQDITHLLTLLPHSSPSSVPIPPHKLSNLSAPLPPFPLPGFLLPVFTFPPPALRTYITHIQSLSSSSSTAPSLLAHAYVRYLGDMSGGQFIAARIRRSYSLKDANGLRFFHFDQSGRGAEEVADEPAGETKRRLGELKDWYRRGMNEGVGEDKDLKTHLVKEANLAFALNTQLFSLIQPTSHHTSNGVSSSPTSNGSKSKSISKGSPSQKVEQIVSTASPTSIFKWGILGRVITVVLAILVGQALRRVGPYLGERWALTGGGKLI